jgi:hypothetical protein
LAGLTSTKQSYTRPKLTKLSFAKDGMHLINKRDDGRKGVSHFGDDNVGGTEMAKNIARTMQEKGRPDPDGG